MLYHILWIICRRDGRLNNGRQETIRYTIEREFLSKITVTELINRIIQAHVKEQTGKEAVSP
ncbi:MAG: hypothetical protein HDT40_06745 [Lachnospiraceae bacterium]|nr:hypothetical protein [Lachnospiraceae bacterium]